MYRTGLLDLVLRARSILPQPYLPAVCYHRVAMPVDAVGFDTGVVDATPELFDQHLGLIAKHFTPVGVDDLIGYLEGEPFPNNPIVISFDDGYRDNLDAAVPILQRHRLKAIFFVATDYVERRRLFWWDQIAWLIGQSKRSEIVLEYPTRQRIALGGEWLRAELKVLRIIKDTWALELDRFLDGLAEACGVEWSDAINRELADRMLLDWDGVRALRSAGMDVGSHTRTHRVLHKLPAEQVDDELRGSKQLLEAKLGEPVHAMSFPVSGREVVDRPLIRRAIREAGYRLAFSNSTGVNNLWSGLDRFGIRRFSTDLDVDEPMLRAMLALPALSGQR
jgi:peptidoglycan/xylan/chitin deacetylase (PgdA/CDA1 family)